MGTAKRKEDEGSVWAESIISGRTFEPLVDLHWGKHHAQLSLEEAREIAMHILEAAEAAESDAFVFQWLTRDIIGTKTDQEGNWEQAIGEFKRFREARRK